LVGKCYRGKYKAERERDRCGSSVLVSTSAFGTSYVALSEAYGSGARNGSHATRILAAFVWTCVMPTFVCTRLVTGAWTTKGGV